VGTHDELTEDQKRHLLGSGLIAMPDLSVHTPCPHDTLNWTRFPDDGVTQSGWKVYLDGSLRDGPSDHLGRTGFGFIAYDAEGHVRAAACGVPPPWINCIHGAEMWAFFAATRCSLPGVAYRSDGKADVDTFIAGKTVGTASSVEHGKLWKLIFAACDDVVDPHLNVDYPRTPRRLM